MNLAQALGVAAASLLMGLSAGGFAPVQTVSRITAEAQSNLRPAAICAAEELAAIWAFPKTESAEAAPDPQRLAAWIKSEPNAIRADALLHAMSSDGFAA